MSCPQASMITNKDEGRNYTKLNRVKRHNKKIECGRWTLVMFWGKSQLLSLLGKIWEI